MDTNNDVNEVPEPDEDWLVLESDPIPAGPHADRRFVL